MGKLIISRLMKLKLLFNLSLVASIVLVGYIIFSFINDHSTEQKKILATLEQEKEKIEKLLLQTESVAKDLSTKISSTKLEDLKALLLESIVSDPNVSKLRIAFAPNVFEEKPFYAIDIKRQSSQVVYNNLSFNYTIKTPLYDSLNSDWYCSAIKTGAHWNEPRKEYTSSNYLVDYSVPFKIGDQSKITYDGVVCVSLSVDLIHEFVKALKFKKTGYATLLSPKGRFIYHPKDELVRDTMGIFGLAHYKMSISKKRDPVYKNSQRLIQIATKAVNGETGCDNYTSIVSYQPMKYCYMPLYNGWSLSSLCLKKEFIYFYKDYKPRLFWVSLLILINLCLAVLYFIEKRAWLKSILITCLFGLGLMVVWYMNYQFPKVQGKEELVIGDYEGLQTFQHKYDGTTGTKAIFIPTGVFVQSIEFSSANNIKATGYIWQHYKLTDTITSRGFVLPEAEDLSVEVAYEKTQGDVQSIGWYFSTTIRERFDYADFPFDREKLWLRLWHKDFDKNVVLVPDVNSYDVINPSFMPGIEKDFVLAGWNMVSSYFSYIYNSYNTNFGIKDYIGQTDFPELYFNVGLARVFINPFISHLIPLLVVMLMLFSILQVGKKNDKKGVLGFNSLSAVSACSALFFVVIFNHINIRSSLSVSGIVYFEWFYIVCYLAIMYVSVSAILIAKDDGIKLFQYKENFYSRILFGPVIVGICYVITFVNFY